MANEIKLNEKDLERVTGGMTDEERKKEIAMRGNLSFDPVTATYTFTDKHGNIGTFTAQQWETMSHEWDYTGDPQWWMRTLDVGELQAKLQ